MDMYGQVANAYGQELQNGVRLQAGLDQQAAQQPNTLFDRFMTAYQQKYLQRKAEAEMARKQQHEDTYMKMAEEKDRMDKARALNSILDDVSQRYNGDPAQKQGYIAALTSLGKTPEEAASYIPPDTEYVPDTGKSVGTLNGQDITLPQTSADIQRKPGMGGEYKLRQAAALLAEKRQAEANALAQQGLDQRERMAEANRLAAEQRQAALFGQQNALADRKQNALLAVIAAKSGGGAAQPSLSERKFQKQEEADNLKRKESAQLALDNLDEIERYARELADPNSGLDMISGRVVGRMPEAAAATGDKAARALAKYKVLSSRLTKDAMDSFRAASRTGATGFGALNQKELEVIQNYSRDIQLSQNPEDVRKSLGELIQRVQVLKQRLGGAVSPAAPDGGDVNAKIKRLRELGVPDAEIAAAIQKDMGSR